MTKKQIFSTSYFFSGSFFLGYGYHLMVSVANYDSWLGAIFGIILGCIFIAMISFINKKKGKKALNDYLNQFKVFGPIMRIIFIFVTEIFAVFLLFDLQSFISTFFLLKTSTWMITLPLLFLMILFGKNGMKSLGRVAEILFAVSIPIVFFLLIAFIQYIKLDNIMPIMIAPPIKIAHSGLIFAVFSTAPYLFLLNLQDDGQYYLRNYLITALVSFIILFFIISVLGSNLINIYRYPEYIFLKEFNAFNFIERVENIISIIWIFNCIISLGAASITMNTLIPKKNTIIFGSILFLILYFSSTQILANQSLFYELEDYLPFIILLLFLVVLLPVFIYSLANKSIRKTN